MDAFVEGFYFFLGGATALGGVFIIAYLLLVLLTLIFCGVHETAEALKESLRGGPKK